jgi:hypothetical protein
MLQQSNILHRESRRYTLPSSIVYSILLDTSSLSPTPAPSDYPLIAWWRADSLTLPNLTVISGSNKPWASIDTHGNVITGSTSTGPKYQVSSSVFSQSVVVFAGQNLRCYPIDLSSAIFTMAIVCYSSADGMLIGSSDTNLQIRKFQSAANTISMYNRFVTIVSSTLSTAAGKPVVCWFQRDNTGTARFYENQTARGTSVAWAGFGGSNLNEIGDYQSSLPFTGGIIEIAIWNYAFSAAEIKNMYLNYFKIHYPGAFSG